MDKSWRRRLFYFLILAFVVLGAGLLFYSQGYRIDFAQFDLNKVGAIYVRTFPADAHIELNGESIQNESWLLQSGTLINGLFPRAYHVRLSQEGYHTWEQTVEVTPALVRELSYSVLIPRLMSDVTAATTTTNIWLMDDQLITADEEGMLQNSQEQLPGTEVVNWTRDFKKILTFDERKRTYSLWAPQETPIETNVSTLLKNLSVAVKMNASVKLDEGGLGELLVQDDERLSLVDMESRRVVTLETLHSTSTAALQFASSTFAGPAASNRQFIAWAITETGAASSTVKVYDKSARRTVSVVSFQDDIKKIAFINEERLAILQADGSLYVYEIPSRSLREVASGAWDFQFNNDGTMVAAFADEALEIISLTEKHDYWRVILPDIKAAHKPIWYRDNRHLFLQYPDGIKFLDVNDERLEHFHVLSPARVFAYDSEDNRAYFVNEGKIMALDLPK